MKNFTKSKRCLRRKRNAERLAQTLRIFAKKILVVGLLVLATYMGYLLVDQSSLDEFMIIVYQNSYLTSKGIDLIKNFNEIRFVLWFLESLIVSLITIMYTQSNDQSNYIDAWDFASLAWTLIFSIVYLVNLAKVPSFTFLSVISGLIIFSTLVIGLLSKVGVMGGFLNKSFRYFIATYTPFGLMLFFSILDYKVANTISIESINEIKKISAYLFSIVDIPFFITTLFFTFYYQIFLVLLCKQSKLFLFDANKILELNWPFTISSSEDQCLIEKIEVKKKELEVFFYGAISLQLISANILFAMVDSGIISTLVK